MPRTTKKAGGKARWQAAIKYRPLTTLSPHENNPKTHGTEQIRSLSRSMAAHNFVNPILIDTQGVIIAGHARFEAAKLLGLPPLPRAAA